MKARRPPWLVRFGSLIGGRLWSALKPRASRGLGRKRGGPPENWRAVAQHHPGPAMHGLYRCRGSVHPGRDSRSRSPTVVVVLPQADDGEAALIVERLRGADIKEARAIWKSYDIINMCGNANVFVEILRGCISGDAGLWRSKTDTGHKKQRRAAAAKIFSEFMERWSQHYAWRSILKRARKSIPGSCISASGPARACCRSGSRHSCRGFA